MGEYMEIDVSEAIEGKEGGFWFDFEEALVNKDASDPLVYSEGDLSSTKPSTRDNRHGIEASAAHARPTRPAPGGTLSVYFFCLFRR